MLCVAALTRARREDGAVKAGRRTAGVIVTAFMAVVLAAGAARVVGGGYEPRYTAGMFALVLVVAGVGVARLPARIGGIVLAGVCVVGLSSAALAVTGSTKTQAGVIASVIRAGAQPGDVVVYCPDQLGPAVSRLLPGALTQTAFPTGPSVTTVDWVDYAKRNAQASPAAFAMRVDRMAARGAIWLVDVPHGYATFGNKCGQLAAILGRGRVPTLLVPARSHSYYEFANLTSLTREATG